MTVLTVIMGIIMIMGGIAVFFTPIETFLALGYFLAILFLAYGISGIIKAFMGQSHVLEIVLDILSILVGIACIVRPGSQERFDTILLIIIATWFIIQGVFTIAISIRVKDIQTTWFLGLIMGVLSVALGIISFMNPLFEASVIGYLVGFYFIESGMDMIVLGMSAHAIKKQAEAAVDMVKDEYNRYTNQNQM